MATPPIVTTQRSSSVYLDWNATTPLRPEAQEAWLAVQRQAWANPASSHRPGQRALAMVDGARRDIAASLSTSPHQWVFTGSGTEAINLAMHTAVAAATAPGPVRVLASQIDHSAVLRGAERIAAIDLALVPVDDCGRIMVTKLQAALSQPPALVCLQWANNELGTVQDLPALVALIRSAAPQALILVDACQGMGKQACAIEDWDIDMLAASAHKFGGPRGVGLLWHRVGLPVASQINGGRQQDDRRSGSEDVAGACATAAALQAALAEQSHSREMLNAMVAEIQQAVPEVVELAVAAPRLSNTCNLACPAVSAHALQARLDLAGFAVSVGSACMARANEPSHVVAALPIPDDLKGGNIRVSIGAQTSRDDVAAFAQAYITAVTAMRQR